MTNVFIISEGDDVGGVAIAIQRAFEKYDDNYTIRSMRGTNNYIDYPVDLNWNSERFHQLWEWADIIHAMEKFHNLTPHYNPPGKPMVIHHHGSIYRDSPASLDKVSNEHNLQQICSTLDLTIFNDRVKWIPNPIDIDLMRSIRAQYRPTSDLHKMVFIHSPTQRWQKGTDSFAKAVKAVRGKLQYVEGRSWLDALSVKATGDVLLDQLNYGYGLSGLEAMAMGMPVVGGLEPQLVDVFETTLQPLPFLRVERGSIAKSLYQFRDRVFYDTVAEQGEAYVNDYHSQKVVVGMLKLVYEEAMDTYTPEGPWA